MSQIRKQFSLADGGDLLCVNTLRTVNKSGDCGY